MRILIGGQYYSSLEAQSVRVQRSATDPVPTCMLNLIDNASSLNPQYSQELIILDEKITPNPTINLALTPNLNPYTNGDWTLTPPTGITLSQGSGVILTFANTANVGPSVVLAQTLLFGLIVPGQTYIFSVNVQGGSTPTAIGACIFIKWQSAANVQVGATLTFSGPVPVSTSLTQYTVSGVAPAGAVSAILQLGYQTSSGTNSGTITFTNAQFEPEWFPTQSYPTPFCGPNQTNCVKLPMGQWIRQYRRFAGFITRIWPQAYHGNVRTIQITASGYAVLCSTIYANDSFSGQADSAIITSLANKYLKTAGLLIFAAALTMVNLTNVVQGINTTTIQSNWDDLRTLFDGLCALSGFIWTIDYYWNLIYTPPGYFSQGIGLICDNSSQPNNTTTFPAYDFSAESDFSQPGSTILCLGSGTNVSLVSDLSQLNQIGLLSGYYMPPLQSWMRKINDATLGSTTDTTNRALAELMLYDFPRKIYHLKTQIELIPGQSVQLTSATEGLTQSTQLVQQTTGTWQGTDETLHDVWEYQSDLGAVNRTVTQMISRIHRQTQKGTSAPAIAATTLVALENPLGILESSIGTGTTVVNYAQKVMPDTPTALYPLNEITGTIADDIAGVFAYQGVLNGGITLGATGLLTDAADTGDTAFTFNGSTGYVSLPTGLIPTGSAHAWSLECWVSVAVLPGSNLDSYAICMGTAATKQGAYLVIRNTAGTVNFALDCFGAAIVSASTVSINTTYHMVGTYDGTSIRLYVNGALVAGPTAFVVSLGTTFASIAAQGSPNTGFFNGTLQYPGIYNFALSATQVSNHNAAGRP